MKNIYLAQPNYTFGDSVYLPYSIGVLAAAAFSDEKIKKHYILKKMFFLRDKIENVIAELEEPFLVGFSCYNWNFEYNKKLASEIKARFPDCIILFGGHQIKNYSIEDLKENNFIDILSYGEGELTFKNLLLELISKKDLSGVNNISYVNSDGEIVVTSSAPKDRMKYISPYAMGLFDDLINEYPQYTFSAIFETSRGCPFSCAYCDWGAVNNQLIKFDFEGIKKDIDWIAKNKIEYAMGADSNFGIFDRDNQIIDLFIEAKKKWDYPKALRFYYTKNSTETIFLMNKKLNEYDMSKGATLSFQSLNPIALENIGRKNIKIETFFKLVQLYRINNIPTYSELIIGIPGENYISFCDGIDTLLSNGQHASISIYNCELLRNSKLASDDCIKKHNIETVKVPLYRLHGTENKNDITEYSDIIISTSDMPKKDWVKMNIFSWAVQCFHCLGLLQTFAIYLKYEHRLDYTAFYNLLISYLRGSCHTLAGRIFNKIENVFNNVLDGASAVYICEHVDNLLWPPEEGSFIEIIEQKDVFYSEIEAFLKTLSIDDEVYNDLFKYQKGIVKSLNKKDIDISLKYDWHSYFNSIYINEYRPLEKNKNTAHINIGKVYDNLYDYSVEVVWYGRKGGNNFYSDIHIRYD